MKIAIRKKGEKVGVSHNPFSIRDDGELIRLWLHNRSPHTMAAYQQDVLTFLDWMGEPLHKVTLADLQDYYDAMEGAEATRRRKLSSIKSLISFGARQGYLPVDPGMGFRIPHAPDSVTERIITQEEVLELIKREDDPRRRALLRVLYVMGLRISEACALTWKDMLKTRQGGTMNVFGKGGKSRQITVPPSLWKELDELRANKSPSSPVIPGGDGGPLNVKAAHRIVKRAGKRIGRPEMSAHWLRHACASHAQDNGAPPHVVQQQLGHASLNTTTRYSHARAGDSAASYLKG